MTTTDLPTPMPRYRSYSAMTTYMECGEQYRLKYIERHREEPSVWSVGGTAFHQVAEWYLDGTLGDLTPEDDRRIANAWDVAWDLAYNDVLTRDPSVNPDIDTWRIANRGAEGPTWWQWHGQRMVMQFIEWRTTVGKDLQVLSVGDRRFIEAELLVTIGGVPVRAIPDAVVLDEHGQVCILDWKSGRKAPASSLQLGVYAAAVRAATGLDPVWGLFYLTRKSMAVPHDLSLWPHDEIGRLFHEFDTRERAGHYPARPGSHCRFCGVREHCVYKKEST